MTAPSPNSRRIALTAFRIFAWVTGVGLLLLCAAMVNHYLLGGSRRPVALVGMMHGYLYMGYVVSTLVLAERFRWRPLRALLVALAGTIPLASFVAERRVTRLAHEENVVAG